MKQTRFIGVVGHKKSGKTTLVELLASEMTGRGIAIGTIKMTTHDLEFDLPGKDTDRHRRAGAQVTLIKSKSQAALFTGTDYLDDDTILTIFGKCDFVFIEGDNAPQNPKIYVADERQPRQDIAGEIIAVWGTKKAGIAARHFANDEISMLCDYLIHKFQN